MRFTIIKIDYNNEINCRQLKQYSRRENIEFNNIPESVDQRNMWSHLFDVLASVDVRLESYDIVAVHRFW